MEIDQFDFSLPPRLIAQTPGVDRSSSRMLAVNIPPLEADSDSQVDAITRFLQPGDLVVLNDTRVIPARLYGRKPTGGRVEIFLERLVSAHLALCQLRSNSRIKPGIELTLDSGECVTVGNRQGRFFEVASHDDLLSVFEQHGSTPLPPYIDRLPNAADRERYQTVFARVPGAVAAPTAGLHIDETLLDAVAQRGCEVAFLTLHVGAGTFAPITDDNIETHRLHTERIEVSAEVCDAIRHTHGRGGRVFAIGTTVVRALEAAALGARNSLIEPVSGETQLFIRPGFNFQIVDGLLTNFHLPRSTLLMLVCAFAGTARVMRSYRLAVERSYRFYSYGDAMLLLRDSEA